MKTDLAKILSVSGQHGLFLYIAQARNGAIVEALSDKRRTCFDMKSRITTLADISIYTSEGELKLKDVFEKLHAVLGEADAPSSRRLPLRSSRSCLPRLYLIMTWTGSMFLT